MKYYILPFLTMLFSAVCGAESLPFDCATPIILAPILQYMRENPDDEAGKGSFLAFSKPLQTVFTLSRRSPADYETTTRCEGVLEITYEIPDKHTFRLFTEKGLAIKLQHIDGKGKVAEYKQIARDMIDQIHFDDAEYEKRSRDCLLKVYEGESPFRFLQEGRHTAIFNYKFKDYLGIGSVVLREASLEYKFSYHNGKLNNAGLKSKTNRILVFSLTIHGGKIKSANMFDNSPLRSGFDCIFHDDMGLWMYSPMSKGIQNTVTVWGSHGKDKTVYDMDDWMKKGMPMNTIPQTNGNNK